MTDIKEMTELKDGEPCSHPGCLLHVTHPCEGCGRVSGRTLSKKMTDAELVEAVVRIMDEKTGYSDGILIAFLTGSLLSNHKTVRAILEAALSAERGKG